MNHLLPVVVVKNGKPVWSLTHNNEFMKLESDDTIKMTPGFYCKRKSLGLYKIVNLSYQNDSLVRIQTHV